MSNEREGVNWSKVEYSIILKILGVILKIKKGCLICARRCFNVSYFKNERNVKFWIIKKGFWRSLNLRVFIFFEVKIIEFYIMYKFWFLKKFVISILNGFISLYFLFMEKIYFFFLF